MGMCQSSAGAVTSDATPMTPTITQPVQESEPAPNAIQAASPPAQEDAAEEDAEEEDVEMPDFGVKEDSDTVGLKEISQSMKAHGKLHEAVIRMETPIGIQIEDVYDGVHDGQILGSGISGVVRQVKHKATGIEYASKSIDLGLIKCAESQNQLRNEISIMCQVDHPNIVRLEEVYESEHEIYLVMELCEGGDLFDRLDEMPDYHYTENQCARLVKQMLSSLVYLHSKEIIHRDLKLENFLFSSRKPDSELKLIDFGLSKHFHFGETQHDAVGTPYTVAPEVIKGSYDERADVWAVGVIIYLLLSGETPFGGCDGENLHQVRDNILRGSFAFEPIEIWENVSTVAKNLIRKLLVVDYHKRPQAKDVLRDKWIERVNGYDSCGESMHGNGLNPNVVRALVSFKEYSDMRKLLLEILSFTLLPEQIEELRSDFEKLDVNSDGEISLEELKQLLVENAEEGCLGALTNEEVEQIFDAMRVRKTETTIRWHEFLAAGLTQCKLDERNLRLAFNRLDADRTGYITFDNVMDLVGSNGNRAELEETWRDSVKTECSSDAERIYYDDFVLLMKGQTKEDMVQMQKRLSMRSSKPPPPEFKSGEGDTGTAAVAEDGGTSPSEVLKKGRARSMDLTPMDSDIEMEYVKPPMLVAATSLGGFNARTILEGNRKIEHVTKDATMSPLVVNKKVYRANREMRLGVLEASKQFEESQARRATGAGLVMKRGTNEQEVLDTAKKRSGRTRRYRTCSDLTGMVMVAPS